MKRNGAFVKGVYTNLFKINGHTGREISFKINKAFDQLFYGDRSSQAIYFEAGVNHLGNLAYVLDVLHQDVRSEGMSYGLMITLQLNKKAEFDALWNFSMTHMYIEKPGHPAEGYFAWSVQQNGVRNAEGPAPDGEEYIVTALYMAAGRWGNGTGIYNYQAWADKILNQMRHHPIHTMINEEKKMILFVPQTKNAAFSDPSYHLPAFYELWALCGPKADRSFWAAAADTSRAYFQKTTNPSTGLSSDYADFDGKPVHTSYNPDADHFAYDAWRTVMNWSVDWNWWHKDVREKELSYRIQAFFYRQGIQTYGSVYTKEGELIRAGHPAGLVSTNAVASLASEHPKSKEFVEALWDLPVPHNIGDRYYGGLLYLMSLLHCSGKFQLFLPVVK
ncbi:glycoside hydrolase family 8 [Mucilaginibacter paludis DSM 18603]|uniref:cellulase n=1 Tax=Mucilaginibacter paludis DSM 18603 TaxID=714943 RepID=H1YH20_9SPHI|nr:glycoside hydrolase family 8 [Mucilaginibacter paludis DSM 18603]